MPTYTIAPGHLGDELVRIERIGERVVTITATEGDLLVITEPRTVTR